MVDMRAMVSRHDDFGRTSGGGNAWHAVPQIARASLAGSDTAPASGFAAGGCPVA
jgi:hypothetical protein